MKRTAVAVCAMLLSVPSARGEVYAYMNEDGDYVVTTDRPGSAVGEYAVLTDDGEFVRLVNARELDVPVTHWRPWFLPKQPDPYDADPDEREGEVGVEEVERRDDAQ